MLTTPLTTRRFCYCNCCQLRTLERFNAIINRSYDELQQLDALRLSKELGNESLKDRIDKYGYQEDGA